MAKKQTNKRTAAGADNADGNVDKIRDILFGGQMRDFEKRFEALEKDLVQAIERVGRDMDRRLDRLDKYARREIDKLAEQVKTERKDRNEEARKGAGELSNFATQVETWFAEVEEQFAEESKDLRQLLHAQTDDFGKQISKAHKQLQVSMKNETDALSDSKLAREDLAEVLSDVAMRLNKDRKLPKS